MSLLSLPHQPPGTPVVCDYLNGGREGGRRGREAVEGRVGILRERDGGY